MNLRSIARNLLLKTGWDIRRAKSWKTAKIDEWRRKELDSWRILQTYAPDAVLDIGANTGQFAAITRQLLPNARILSFEPLRECYESLCKRQQELAPLDCYAFALGNSSETRTINRNAFTPSSSLLPMNPLHKREIPQSSTVDPEAIEVRRLDDLASQLQLPERFVAKIDVQGYTEPVLTGGHDTLINAQAIIAEVSLYPLYAGEATFDQIYTLLRSWGFHYRGNVSQWISNTDYRILQCDCLFDKQHFEFSTPQQHTHPDT